MKTLLFLSSACLAAAQQYAVSTFAGGAPPPTPIAASKISVPPNPGIWADSGNIYFSSSGCVFKIDPNGVLTRVAGNSRWGTSAEGGPATSAEFSPAGAVVMDYLGNLYVADGNQASGQSSGTVRKIAADGTVTTVVTGLSAPQGDAVRFAVDPGNNIYILDGSFVRKLPPNGGAITTVAGTGELYYSGDGTPATHAGLGIPTAIAADRAGNFYIASVEPFGDDYQHSRVRVVTSDGVIRPFAGTDSDGYSGDGGPATSAQLSAWISALAIDRAGNLRIVDAGNHAIRKITPAGVITSVVTLDQSGCYLSGSGPYICAQDIAADAAGDVYIVGQYSQYIQMLGSDGSLTTIEGGGGAANIGDGGLASSAPLASPLGITIDGSHNVYIADSQHSRIRKIAADGTVTTVAGNGSVRLPGDPVVEGGSALSTPLACASTPSCKSIAVDNAGNFYFPDYDRVRKVSASGVISTVSNLAWASVASDGKNVFIADLIGCRVLKLAPDGTLTPVAGGGISGDGGPATSAQLHFPDDLAVDAAGDLFIAEYYPARIRKVAPDGTISTIAGAGTLNGENVAAAASSLDANFGIAADRAGNVYVAEFDTDRVRKISTSGSITTIAGGVCNLSPDNPCGAYTGDGGPALKAQFWGPARVAVDSDGTVYVSDTNNNAIRVLKPVQ